MIALLENDNVTDEKIDLVMYEMIDEIEVELERTYSAKELN